MLTELKVNIHEKNLNIPLMNILKFLTPIYRLFIVKKTLQNLGTKKAVQGLIFHLQKTQ